MVLTEEAIASIPKARKVHQLLADAKLTSQGCFPTKEQMLQNNTAVFQHSVACCGLSEIQGSYTVQDYFIDPNRLAASGLRTEDEFQQLNLMYLLSEYRCGGAWYDLSPRSFWIYNSIRGSGISKRLLRLGFSKITSFANEVHDKHEVEMLGCHNVTASQAIREGRVSWWPTSSNMKPA